MTVVPIAMYVSSYGYIDHTVFSVGTIPARSTDDPGGGGAEYRGFGLFYGHSPRAPVIWGAGTRIVALVTTVGWYVSASFGFVASRFFSRRAGGRDGDSAGRELSGVSSPRCGLAGPRVLFFSFRGGMVGPSLRGRVGQLPL